jgi:hypothetical protein
MFVEEKSTDSGYNIRNNGSRHIGQIAFLKNKREEIIKADI